MRILAPILLPLALAGCGLVSNALSPVMLALNPVPIPPPAPGDIVTPGGVRVVPGRECGSWSEISSYTHWFTSLALVMPDGSVRQRPKFDFTKQVPPGERSAGPLMIELINDIANTACSEHYRRPHLKAEFLDLSKEAMALSLDYALRLESAKTWDEFTAIADAANVDLERLADVRDELMKRI